MPTAKTLLEQFVEEQQIGRVGSTSGAGSTTTIVAASSRFAGPKSGNEWDRGDPIRVTSGAAIGNNTELDDYAPATGTLTVLPAITAPGTPVAFFIVKRKYADHADRLFEALSRGLNRYARRKMKVPLTYIPDGDLLGAAVATFWASVTAAPTYVDLAHPNGYATRVLNIVTSGLAGYATPATNDIPCHPGQTWDLLTWMRANAATSTAELQIVTAAAATITPTILAGALTTTSLSFVLVKLSFEVPAGVYGWRPRLIGQENPATVQFGPIIAAPRETLAYTSQAHFEFPSHAGAFYEGIVPTGTNQGPEEIDFIPRTYACDIDQLGWGLAFQFRTTPAFPVYYEAMLGYADLSAEADSTHCPEDLALAAMALEFWSSKADATRDEKSGRSPYDIRLRRAEEHWEQFKGRFSAQPRPVVRQAYQGRVIV